MATYENIGLLNTPNINNNSNNNNNNLDPSLSTPSSRESYDYSYNQQVNSKSSNMLKDQPQNVTTIKRDLMPPENETNYLTSTDMDSTPRLNETTKRVNNANGKFS
ncbi:unnamed protein product, partial [Rotaria magnacalcarata]